MAESTHDEGVGVKNPRTGTLYWLPLILGCDRLDPTETLLMVSLADHVNGRDECYVGIKNLARAARVSYSTARRRLAKLEAAGWIGRERRRRDDGNLSVYDYVLVREAFDEPALNLAPSASPSLTQVSDDQRSPGWHVTSAHPGERAEPPRSEPPHVEPTTTSLDEHGEVYEILATMITTAERDRRRFDPNCEPIRNFHRFRDTVLENAPEDYRNLVDVWIAHRPELEADPRRLAEAVLSGSCPACSDTTWVDGPKGMEKCPVCCGEAA